MVIVGNIYKQRVGITEREAAENIILGFTGELRTWWDKLLSNEIKNNILTARRIDSTTGEFIIDSSTGQPQSFTLAYLVYNIISHFIGDLDLYTERNSEILQNLKCRKLENFRWYKDNFLKRVYALADPNAFHWKEKFLTGLPRLFSTKVKETIEQKYGHISYDDLTYGDLITCVNLTGIRLCRDMKLQNKLKMENRQSRKELGNWCEQFGFGTIKKQKHRKYKPFKTEKIYKKYNYQRKQKPFKKNNYRKNNFKRKNNKENITCYLCNQKGHYAKECPAKKKIYELGVELKIDNIDQLLEKIDQIKLSSSELDEDYNSDDSSETINSTDSDHNCIGEICNYNNKINVLTEYNQILEQIEQVQDSNIKRKFFKKLSKVINEELKQGTEAPTNFEEIEQMFRHKKPVTTISSMDLQSEIRQLKLEVRQLKYRCDQLEQNQNSKEKEKVIEKKEEINSGNESDKELKFNDITRIKYQKWYVKINLTIKDFKLETIAMLDSGADMNCIDQGIIPSRYFHKTKQTLSAANSTKVKIDYKIPSAHICNKGICFKTSFMLIKNLNTQIILGNPFLQMLYPFKVTQLGLETNVLGQDIIFQFISPINYHDVNLFQQENISKINNLEKQIKFLKDDLHSVKIEEQLEKPNIQQKIKEIQEQFERDLCSDLPTAFWARKQHIVTLPYESDFKEQNIPTKARPIQMNQEMLQFCKKEIQDLLAKNLIRPSKSPWSCAAFYVIKNAEIERGAPRLVINYKPLNKVLRWIRYPIPNKQDLLNRLYKAEIFFKI
ncbi:hypothetical protein MANES_17G011850v8 [Manihot esculenta]|uniref:Uncharacterized protein n=1 Tax=Manihot esculenta TaxID=3983 RepID=A0ACB7G3H4_MANES|nr:hypothetical protein MANES_17G011850v8 [Manihot esculenta]